MPIMLLYLMIKIMMSNYYITVSASLDLKHTMSNRMSKKIPLSSGILLLFLDFSSVVLLASEEGRLRCKTSLVKGKCWNLIV